MLAILVVLAFPAFAAEEQEFPPRVNPGRIVAVRKMNNPVRFDSQSIAAGKAIYFGKGLCVNCHGADGKGDGPGAAAFDPGPRDFTNAKWQKVRSDGEIFVAITEGTQFGMIAFDDSLTVQEKWDLVNYIRMLGGRK